MSIKSFGADKRGNVAMMFSLAAVPLVLAIGAATDILRMNNTQTLLQGATDAAALAGASAHGLGASVMNQTAADSLKANGAIDAVQTITIQDSGIEKGTGRFHVNFRGTVDTTFMALAGISTLDVGAYSEVEIGGQALEVALVLDNTASMNSEGRLDSLKAAAKSLVSQMVKDKPADGYLKIGIVPFADYVNVGMANRSAAWMDVPNDWNETIKNYPSVTVTGASGCHEEKAVYNNDGVPTPYTYQVCDNPGTSVTTYSDVVFPHRWYGCVGSRPDPLDRGIASLETRYPGIMDTGCPEPITNLTEDESTLIKQISSMNAVGETYIPSGLLWGWNMLDSSVPITGAKTKAEMEALKGVKSLVLMTDGDNTKSPEYPYHYGSDAALADKITAQLCENIKAENINVYTVAFKVTKASSKDLLTACASSASQAYNAEDAAGLAEAFSLIGKSLAQMRLTR
jgi:Flp pilus assembly protein TadG